MIFWRNHSPTSVEEDKIKEKNEIYFEIGRRSIKFGIGEFALITGLNFGLYLDKEELYSTRLVFACLNDSSIVKSHELEATFVACSDNDDAWKLGLVYFIDGVLYSHSHEPNSKVETSLFSLVESKEDFFKYPFGKESFQRTLIGLDKDMIYL